MAAAHTKITLPTGEWTSVYAAAGTKTLTVCNVGHVSVRLRCDAAAVVGDSLETVGYLILNPGQSFGFGVVTGDDVFAAPHGHEATAISLLVQ